MKYDRNAVIALGASLALVAGYFYLKSNEKKPETTPAPTPTGGDVGGTNPAATAWRRVTNGQLGAGKVYRTSVPWNIGTSPDLESLLQLERDSQYTYYGGFNPLPADWPETNVFAMDAHHEFRAARDLSLRALPSNVKIWEHV